MKKEYRLVFAILIYFFVTSMLGVVVGDWINNTFDIRPAGTIFSLVGFYIISWVGIFAYIKIINKSKDVSN